MPLDRLTQITNAGITSGITITGVNLTGVITATSATVGSEITLSGTQINVGSATTIHSNGFLIGSSTLHSTGLSLQNVNIIGVATVSAGSAAAPSISPSGDSNTGIFFPAADTVAIGEGGAEVLRVNSNGFVGIGTTTGTLTSLLNVNGTTRLGASINYGSTSILSVAPGAIEFDAPGISGGRFKIDLNGNIGMGIANPTQPVHIFKTSYPTVSIDAGSNKELRLQFHTGDNTANITSIGAFPLVFQTNSVERARVTASGYIQTPFNSAAASGLDIGHQKVVSITGSFAANTWYNTGITRETDTGTFLVSCYFDTWFGGGQSYQMRYVGWFVMPSQGTNSGDAYGITLHRAGHAPNGETLQLRTLLTGNADSRIYLQWLSNFAITLDGTGGKQFYIALHRFTTAYGG